MYYVYAIGSLIHNYVYIGISGNVEARFARHNNGYTKNKHYPTCVVEQFLGIIQPYKGSYWKKSEMSGNQPG